MDSIKTKIEICFLFWRIFKNCEKCLIFIDLSHNLTKKEKIGLLNNSLNRKIIATGHKLKESIIKNSTSLKISILVWKIPNFSLKIANQTGIITIIIKRINKNRGLLNLKKYLSF